VLNWAAGRANLTYSNVVLAFSDSFLPSLAAKLFPWAYHNNVIFFTDDNVDSNGEKRIRVCQICQDMSGFSGFYKFYAKKFSREKNKMCALSEKPDIPDISDIFLEFP
jgi:hypothetical protein